MREKLAGDRNEVGVEEWRREGWTRYGEERLNCAKVKQAERERKRESGRKRENKDETKQYCDIRECVFYYNGYVNVRNEERLSERSGRMNLFLSASCRV